MNIVGSVVPSLKLPIKVIGLLLRLFLGHTKKTIQGKEDQMNIVRSVVPSLKLPIKVIGLLLRLFLGHTQTLFDVP
jgi:hypothetical protein